MIIWLLLIVLVVPFGFVLLFGAPYLPTRRRQIDDALALLQLQRGDTFVDLGSGDGSVLKVAAKQGFRCYGYELNPFLLVISRLRTWRLRDSVTIYGRSFWSMPLPDDTRGVFTFLLDRYMSRLDKKLRSELPKGSRLVSYTFQIPSKKPIKRKGALFLYGY